MVRTDAEVEGKTDAQPAAPRSAYIHVPFCRHRCGYCNFTLVAKRDDLIGDYLRALERELSWLESPRTIDTLFIGGGTPTYLLPADLARMLQIVHRWFPAAPGAEISLEANPSDITAEKLAILRDHGVNRLSLGVQSFDAAKLQLLERDHDAETASRHARQALDAGFVVAIDLIFGVPDETRSIWQRDLEAALQLQPHHLSTYGLTWEKGTAFWSRRVRGDLTPLSEDEEAGCYEMAIDHLLEAGFEHYEVSNFARPGFACRHNQAYWNGLPYFAAGPGAARFVDGRRETNHRSVTAYLNRVLSGHSPVFESEQLGAEDAARERMVFGLRQIAGIHRGDFHRETGFDLEELGGAALESFLAHRLLQWQDQQLQLTRAGLLVSDSIWGHFLRR